MIAVQVAGGRGQVAGGRGQGAGGTPIAFDMSRSRRETCGRECLVTIRNYTDLIAWQKAMALAEFVYKTTSRMPREELYGLTSQMRRAAVSIPSNIAEGEGRRKDGQLLHSLLVSYGSLRELETQVLLSDRLNFVGSDDARALLEQCEEVGRLLNGLMKTVASRIRSQGN
jgi:four helix bundle protein